MSTLPPLAALTLAAILFVSATAAATVWWARRGQRHHTPRVVMRRALLTGNELEFLRRAQAAVPEFDIFAQVSQGALMDVSVPVAHPLFWATRGRFDRKIADFVVCRKSDAAVLCILELDDRKHDLRADARRDEVTAAAGLATLRFWSRAKPTRQELREAIVAVADLA